VERKSIVYANNFEANTDGFSVPWRDSLPGYNQFHGRFGYDSGTELKVGAGTSYAYDCTKPVSIEYDFLRFDDWHGQPMHFTMSFNDGGGWDNLDHPTVIDLVKSFKEDHPSGSFDLTGSFYVREFDPVWGDASIYKAYVKMHFEQLNYGQLGFGPSHDEFFHVSINISMNIPGGYANNGNDLKNYFSNTIKLGWYAGNPENRDTRSWGIDNMLISQSTGIAQSQSLVASQMAPNGIFASNAIPLVSSAAAISPLTSPLLPSPSDPSNGLPSSVDSPVSTSNAQVAARLKPVLYRAALKASQVAKRLISL
jgi:hypothetical protein